jgi:hypothetical protein
VVLACCVDLPWREVDGEARLLWAALPQGSVRHPDHNTIVLHGWHRVLMNTERAARAMWHVAYLD